MYKKMVDKFKFLALIAEDRYILSRKKKLIYAMK